MKKNEVSRERKGYFVDTLTSVETQEIAKTGEMWLNFTKGFFTDKFLKWVHLKMSQINCLL